MGQSDLGITDTSRTWSKTLLNSLQTVPGDSLSGRYFSLARHLDHLIEDVNEGWTRGILVEGPWSQPDYSVGFRRSAFMEEWLKRLDPLIGSVYDTSFFVATHRMYFPSLLVK